METSQLQLDPYLGLGSKEKYTKFMHGMAASVLIINRTIEAKWELEKMIKSQRPRTASLEKAIKLGKEAIAQVEALQFTGDSKHQTSIDAANNEKQEKINELLEMMAIVQSKIDKRKK